MAIKTLSYDLVTIGRSSIDLFSNDIGAPFEDIKHFSAFVGGSPANIAIGASRLGLKSCLLSAVGDDKVGDFVLKTLQNEKVDTQYIRKINDTRTAAVLLGIQPPDTFPMVFYRDNAADWHIAREDAERIGFENTRNLLVSGTALARDPSRTATLSAADMAKKSGCRVILDLDFRFDQWGDPRAYGNFIRQLIDKVDVVIGTVEEILATSWGQISSFSIVDQQISNPTVSGNVDTAIQNLLRTGIQSLIVKKGEYGATFFHNGERHNVPGFEVEVVNVLGAGDAFASGLIYGMHQGWDLFESTRWANACGAILVTKNGCSEYCPTVREVKRFIELKENQK